MTSPQTQSEIDEQNDPPLLRDNPFSPFRYPVFRAIWLANVFSNMGSMMQSVAAAWLMTELTHSKQLIALVSASVSTPILLLGVIAGAIADNYDRRRVMMAAQFGMLLVSTSLALLTWLDLINPFLLLACTICVGIGTALNSPAWQASVRQQVERKELPHAIALNSMAFNIARSIGPALGGLLISLWDISLAFALNALSYVALICVLLWWKTEPRKAERRPILPAVAVGLRFCFSSRPIRSILMRGWVVGVSLAAFQALLPAIVRQQLEGDEVKYGLLLGAFGIGSIFAAPFVRPLRLRIKLNGILALSALLLVVVFTVIAEVHSVLAAVPAAFGAGTVWVAALTSLNTAFQLRAPNEILGRCMSIYQSVTIGGMAMGAWTWGMVADWHGIPFALHVASALLVGALVLMHFLAPLPQPGEGIIKDW